jgi:hypothetical protein
MGGLGVPLLIAGILWVLVAAWLVNVNSQKVPADQPISMTLLVQRIIAALLFTLLSLVVVGIFALVLLRIPPELPTILAAKCLSGGNPLEMCRGGYLLDFQDIMPETMSLHNLQRMDTDGDGQDEWVVFYYYDMTTGTGPIAGAIYDNDRGWPPVLFPYQLRLPDRDYLGEQELTAKQLDIIKEQSPNKDVPELLVLDKSSGLSIFRYNQGAKTEEWKPPEERNQVYFPIGVFRGDTVAFDAQSKKVTVWDRGGFATGAMAADHERSQLTTKRVYELRGDTYMNPGDLTALSSPMESYIEFIRGQMLDDILATQYPEKIVLGFYKTMSGEGGGVKPEDFLTGQARVQYDQGRLDYFGIPWGKGDTGGIVRVTQLGYYTRVEEQSAEINIQGLQPLRGQVTVQIVVKPKDQPALPAVQRTWVLVSQEGKWKMEERGS